ncbi:Os03g0237900 [Linum perenne]
MVITQPTTHSKTPAKNENHLLRTAAFLPLLRAMEAELLRRRSRMANSSCASDFRPRMVEFLIVCAHNCVCKRFQKSKKKLNWLLQPIRESSLQLFALVSLWISSKIHNRPPIRVGSLKSLSDKSIKDQHFATRDFLEAVRQQLTMRSVLKIPSLCFLRISFISSSKSCFSRCLYKSYEVIGYACAWYPDKFFTYSVHEFRGVSKFGELLNFEACMDIIDLLYEKESWILSCSPCSLAASTLVASYLITVPKQKWEFPILPWVKFVTACDEDEVAQVVTYILEHVFEP